MENKADWDLSAKALPAPENQTCFFFIQGKEANLCAVRRHVGGNIQESTGSWLVEWHSSQHRRPISGALTLSIHCWSFTHLSSPVPFSLRLDAAWPVDFKEVWEKLFFVSVQAFFPLNSHISVTAAYYYTATECLFFHLCAPRLPFLCWLRENYFQFSPAERTHSL